MRHRSSSGLAISIASGLTENFLRQCADLGAGIMIGLYLRYINDNLHSVSSTTVGLIAVGFYVSSLVFSPVFGALSDSLGRKRFIVLGALIGAVVVQVYPLTFSLWMVFVLLVLEGMGNASETPAMLGFLSDSTQSAVALRGRVMALYEIVSIASTAVGYLIGGVLWDCLGLNGFRPLSLIYLVGVGIVLCGMKETRPAGERAGLSMAEYLQALKNPKMVQLLLTGLIVNSVLGIWFTQTAFQMSGESTSPGQLLRGGFSGVQIGLVLALFAVVFSLGAYFWGYLSAKVNRLAIMIVALCGMYVLLFALYLINHSGNGIETSPGFPLTLLIAILGIGVFAASGFTPVLLRYLADLSEEHLGLGGTIMGLYTVVVSLGRLGGGASGGVAADMLGVDGMILLSVVFLGLALAIMLLTKRLDATRHSSRIEEGARS